MTQYMLTYFYLYSKCGYIQVNRKGSSAMTVFKILQNIIEFKSPNHCKIIDFRNQNLTL